MLCTPDKGVYNVVIGLYFMKKGFLTTKEAAEVLGVSPMTLRRWDQNGKLKVARHPMNNYRLYRSNDIKRLAKKIDKSKP